MKNVLITGGSRGIGYEIVCTLIKENKYKILVVGKNKIHLAQVQKMFSDIITFECDLSKQEDIGNLFSFTETISFYPEIIIHAAGGAFPGDTHPIKWNILNKSILLNLISIIEINSFYIQKLLKCNGACRIVHISSQSSRDGNASPSYALSKAALNNYTKNIARHYAKEGIMVCAVLPGALDHAGSSWDMKRISSPERYENKKKNLPLGRFLKPNDLCDFIKFLVSDNSMSYSGSLIDLTGAE